MINIENKRDFVAVSDFHSYSYPLEKIKKYYLDEFNKVYILGDATDRGEYGDGTGGIKVLEEIKELTEKYPGRVIYIPGNHDEFIIGYAHGKKFYDINLIRNGGKQTINDLISLKEKNPERYNELINWLGKLPIQRVEKCDGKNYVFAHALFNQKLYEHNPNYCLNDYMNETDKKIFKMAENVIWFRKGSEGVYSPRELPSTDSIMIIGHTPTSYRNGSLDLEDIDGNMLKVHCVDGGIAYDGVMLKYVSGEIKPSQTYRCYHEPLLPKPSIQKASQIVRMPITKKLIEEDSKKTTVMMMEKDFFKAYDDSVDENKVEVLNNEIKNIIKFLGNRGYLRYEDTILDKLKIAKEILLNPELISLYCVDVNLREEMKKSLKRHTHMKKEITNYKGTQGFEYDSLEFEMQYYDYFKIIAVDYLIDNCVELYGTKGIELLDAYLYNNKEGIQVGHRFIKNTKGNLGLFRDRFVSRIVKILGIDGIKRVLKLHKCYTINEYIESKRQYTNKNKVKKKI